MHNQNKDNLKNCGAIHSLGKSLLKSAYFESLRTYAIWN